MQSNNSKGLPADLDQQRTEWVQLIQEMALTHPFENLKLTLKSPSFEYCHWRVAAEHAAGFGSVVLRWLGNTSCPEGDANWVTCPPSDLAQGWVYRRKMQRHEFPALLFELQGCDSEVRFRERHEQRVRDALSLSAAERARRADAFGNIPRVYEVTTRVFDRNPYVVAEVLLRARGICEECQRPAPFNKRADNAPYLEVHHVIPLAQGGRDSIDNAMGLCPNCHRKAHFG